MNDEIELSEEQYAAYLQLCCKHGIAEAGTFPTAEEAQAAYPDDFEWDLGGGVTVRNDEVDPHDIVS